MTEEDLERALDGLTEAAARLSPITMALIPAAEFADLKTHAEQQRRYSGRGGGALQFSGGVEIRPSFTLPPGAAAFYAGRRLVGLVTVRKEPLPSAGTPEYVPTSEQPCRLPGGAN